MLKVSEITASYIDVPILRKVSLEIHEGQIVALIGRNGAGKSTLFKTIYGLLQPDEGIIELKGHPIHKNRPDQIKKLGISYMPQGAQLFAKMTVEDNFRSLIRKGQTYDLAFEEIRSLFLNGINLKESKLIIMLDSLLGAQMRQLGGTLSGGQRQIISLARSLLGNPQVLLWDEPSIGLSISLLHELESLIQYLQKMNKAICLIDQRIEWALKVSDMAYVMKKGEIVYSGNPDYLLRNKNYLLTLLGIEHSK